ncbi:hypothetical protein PSFL111601_28100 [Pseudomonas floridensis]
MAAFYQTVKPQMDALQICALAVGVGEDLAEGVVGEAFGGAIRVIDAQHFAVGFAFQPGSLVEGVEVVAVVVLVIGVLARAVLKDIF